MIISITEIQTRPKTAVSIVSENLVKKLKQKKTINIGRPGFIRKTQADKKNISKLYLHVIFLHHAFIALCDIIDPP